jgi:DNA invertase Pin-like site-specific DNA recombinase
MANTQKHFGYIRVSTVAQNLERQLDSLTTSGIATDDIYSDKISGTRESRPGLDALLKVVRSGDSITVASLDRLGRSALHVMTTIADLSERGIDVHSLKPGEDMSGATGKLMTAIMIHVAEWERSMNAERVSEARAARAVRAKDGEQVAGRPRTALTPEKMMAVQKLHASGMKPGQIATNQNISRASVYRILELPKLEPHK